MIAVIYLASRSFCVSLYVSRKHTALSFPDDPGRSRFEQARCGWFLWAFVGLPDHQVPLEGEDDSENRREENGTESQSSWTFTEGKDGRWFTTQVCITVLLVSPDIRGHLCQLYSSTVFILGELHNMNTSGVRFQHPVFCSVQAIPVRNPSSQLSLFLYCARAKLILTF